MIEEGINPENILLFTFTRKGAGEIKERVESKIGNKATGLTVGTYHSVCSRILRKYAHYLGYSNNFTIYDEEDKAKLLKSIVDEKNTPHKIVAYKISDWKNNMVSYQKAIADAVSEHDRNIAEYYRLYTNKIKDQNAMDFDDLIYATIRLLENYPEVLESITSKYKYIMADEFQDSSTRDITLIKLLAGEAQNICMILDDEQSIYSFRGANVGAVLNIRQHFDLKEFVLKQNYRSTKNIVNAARSLIVKNTERIEKEVFTENKDGDKIIFFETFNQKEEAIQAVKIIMALCKSRNLKYKDIAILYRMSFLSRALEEALLANGISYTVIGGCPFYARKEIKDIMCYLRFVYNPQDIQAFERIINTPKRGIGKVGLEKIINIANSQNSGIIDIKNACEKAKLTGKAKKGALEFVDVINKLQDFSSKGASVKEMIRLVVRETNYKDYLKESEKDYEDKLANILELEAIAEQFTTLEDFLFNMTLNSNIDEDLDEESNAVQLLTMHSSKGLEFKAVIVIGANEGVSPHWRADTLKELEEERRLFYVAITRPQEYLFITRPKMVQINGTTSSSGESRFIKEIDESYIVRGK